MQEQLATLAGQLFDAKRAEENAKLRRIQIEEQIAELVETTPIGSKTVDAGNGIKVTIKRALGYKADVDAIRAMDLGDVAQIPVKLVPASYVFDEKAYERLLEEHPSLAAQFAEHVTVTPRKVSVTMKLA
jgi:hypothetical protein